VVKKRKKTPAKQRRRGRGRPAPRHVEPPAPAPAPAAPPPSKTWQDALATFLELSKLESKKIRLQVLQLVDALEREALDVFRLARHLERAPWTDPEELARYGRLQIVGRLREKFASEHVGLVDTATLDEQLEPQPPHWYRQGALLLDCAETLNTHVAAYEYRLVHLRQHDGGRAPSVAHDYLAAEQQRFGLDDDRLTWSLVEVGFIPGRETFVATYRENVIKKHRLRWLARQRKAR
jgi:hypothetical protein